MKRIGLFGGTFDPIHMGHLRAAENAREALSLDSVHLIPAGAPPHRTGLKSSPLDRYAMVALATSGHPAFVASDVEVQRQGPSYTVDTVTAMRTLYPTDELILIVGSDAFGEISSWKEHDRIFSMCRIAVVHRPGEVPRSEMALELTGERVYWVEAAGLPISATDVRRRASEGRSVRYLVPDLVADYIGKRGLYR
jgi:nicotinate-nucleotide adenylyltransferase